MKKKIAVLAMILSMISIAAMGTLAYFTDSDIAHNIITTGTADIVIEEYRIAADGSTTTYPLEPIEIMPGQSVSKVVTVRSLEQASYVRAQIGIVIKDAQGKELPVKDGMITIVPNSQFWNTKENDGWYYYPQEITDGAVTEPLFHEVVFEGPAITNEYQNSRIEIIITVQAVQAAHNGSTVMEAANWPEAVKE